MEKELYVDSQCEEDEFPVLLMDWVEGETMEAYIAANYHNQSAMSMLCYRFGKMAAWLRSQSFAHGDVKPDNIMIRPDGSLTLVDYDGMFVPSMKGYKSPTIGTKDFCHPLRTMDDFDETIDDFSLASIALSLKAISMNSTLLDTYGASDRLLFSENDYRNPSNSKVISALQELMYDKDFCTLYSLFMLALARKELSLCSFRLFVGKKPLLPQTIEDLSTKATKEELKEAFVDEWGVKYSKDGRKLLKAPQELKGCYSVKEGTRIICDDAFFKCSSLTSIEWGVKYSKDGRKLLKAPQELKGCYSVKEGTRIICDDAFFKCSSLTSIVISNSVVSIGDNAFKGCNSLSNVVIPNSVTTIEAGAFWDCSSLTSIVIPNSVVSIGGDNAFKGCNSLSNVVIPNSVTTIEAGAFWDCSSLTSIVIPNSVVSIGGSAFSGCSSLTSTLIPNSVVSIGDSAFEDCCSSLTSIVIPNSVVSIGGSAFSGCSSLTSTLIPNSVVSIGDSAFEDCRFLLIIDIPDSVTSIGNSAFSGCNNLSYKLIIPNSVVSIGDSAFEDCRFLLIIDIPDSVTSIGNSAFSGCNNLSYKLKQELISCFGYKLFLAPYELPF